MSPFRKEYVWAISIEVVFLFFFSSVCVNRISSVDVWFVIHVAQIFFHWHSESLRNALWLIFKFEKNLPVIGEAHYFKRLSLFVILLWKRLGNLYLSFCSGGLCKDLDKTNIIRLDKGFDEDFIVTEELSFFVEMFVLVDVERSIDEFAFVRVPNLSRVVQWWHLNSNEVLVAGNLVVLNGNYKVFALVVRNRAINNGIVIWTRAPKKTFGSVLGIYAALS